jgi:predicted DNA-binding transcriptional regulator YafY
MAMNRLDRALGILLLLRSRKTVSAAELAQQFEVSQRTIYRDLEALGQLGIPVYAEMGRAGGFRLLDGYFLPPVMFSVGEAVSLLLGLASLRRLRAKPFAAELGTAEHKLLAAVPDPLRETLTKAGRLIGFEETPTDMFLHPELEAQELAAETRMMTEDSVITVFLQSLLEKRAVTLHYRSPYNPEASNLAIIPRGLLWDRDRWYLVGPKVGGKDEARLWRADRVLAIKPDKPLPDSDSGTDFDISTLLGRQWLSKAMSRWAGEAPVKIRLTPAQAERLKRDWYYGHARYEALPDGNALMTFGEGRREFVFELLRWLGPGAELVEPQAWRNELKRELEEMLAVY